jgi:hypothetical protein
MDEVGQGGRPAASSVHHVVPVKPQIYPDNE